MTWYSGVCVRKSGHAAITKPSTSLDEIIDEMKKYVTLHIHEIAFTTYITRNTDKQLTLADVFGHPRSRDLMQNKAFLKEITR